MTLGRKKQIIDFKDLCHSCTHDKSLPVGCHLEQVLDYPDVNYFPWQITNLEISTQNYHKAFSLHYHLLHIQKCLTHLICDF